MPIREKRTFDITKLENRSAKEEGGTTITGYAAVFNSRASIGDYFVEEILPGAFEEALKNNSDIRALYNHNWDKPLGRTKSGTLRLEEDEKGLRFEIDLPDTSTARDLVASMERGDIDQCSFLFNATKERWDYDQEPAIRSVEEVELFEISVVTIPAYDDTEAAIMRSKDMDKATEKRLKVMKQITNLLEENTYE